MMRSLVLIAVLAGPAQAEAPRISLVFGPDALNAAPEDIHSVRRIDEGDRGAALVIRLSESFDRLMRDLTTAHVGETGKLLICNELAVEPYLNSPINVAQFVISDTDIARVDRLQALLTGPRCAEVPES
jgi:hypothetical protein